MKLGYLFVDLETTGKDVLADQVWGASYNIDTVQDDGSIVAEVERDFFIKHNRPPSPWVLTNTDYLETFVTPTEVGMHTISSLEVTGEKSELYCPRIQVGRIRVKDGVSIPKVHSPRAFIMQLMSDTVKYHCPIYPVGAQVGGFDMVILNRLKDIFFSDRDVENIAHYRSIEIGSMMMGYASTLSPTGLANCWTAVTGKKHTENYIHGSRPDVDMTRETFYGILGRPVPVPGEPV